MRFVPIFGFLLLLLLLAVMLLNRPSVEAGGEMMKPLPAFALAAFAAKEPWDPEKLKGQVTVLNFFASWCRPCASEMPELVALKNTFPKLHVDGVAWNDDPSMLDGFLKKNGRPFRSVWLDEKGDATIALGIRGIPETIILDRDGMIRYRLSGPLTADMRATTIDPLITKLIAEADHAQ